MLDSYINTMLGTLPTMAVTVIATLAITLIFKTSYTTNFAQGVISALGSYTTMQLLVSNGIPIYYGIFAGIAVGALVGVFIDVAIFRRGRNVNAVGKQIITMGMVSLILGAIPLIFAINKEESLNLMPFVDRNAMWVLFGEVSIQYNTLIYIGIAAVIVAVVFVLLNYSKWGLGVRSTASNEIVAGMMGVNTHAITAITWAIAGGIGAIAAVMLAGFTQMTSYFMTSIQVNAFLAGILGGFATFYGPVLGAVIISLISGVVGCVTMAVSELSTWKETIVYVIILLLILWKPQGLFGPRLVRKV